MTESFRHNGEYPEDPQQQSAYTYGGQQHSYAQVGGLSGAYGEQPAGGYPPPPGYAPATHGARRRARGPMAMLAAVALAAAAVGGGTAYAIQDLTTGPATTAAASTGVSGTTVSAGDKGTVAGVAAAVSPSVVEIVATSDAGQSTGSGVIITGDGQVVTNNHVISGASQIKVHTSDGRTFTAQTVGTDPKKDLALIKLDGASGLKTATLGDSDALRVGDQVVAIGSPEGLSGTVTSGIVSSLNRDVTVPMEDGGQSGQGAPWQQGGGDWPFQFGGQQFNGDTGSSTTTYKAIQTDASLNPGNSGGALIDMSGRIVGINAAMFSAAGSQAGDSSQAGSVGLGFAIPVNTVKSDLAHLRNG